MAFHDALPTNDHERIDGRHSLKISIGENLQPKEDADIDTLYESIRQILFDSGISLYGGIAIIPNTEEVYVCNISVDGIILPASVLTKLSTHLQGNVYTNNLSKLVTMFGASEENRFVETIVAERIVSVPVTGENPKARLDQAVSNFRMSVRRVRERERDSAR